MTSVTFSCDVGHSRESLAAARYAISLAKDHGADLILLHTTEDGSKGQEDLSLETLKNIVPLGGSPVQPDLHYGTRCSTGCDIGCSEKSTCGFNCYRGARRRKTSRRADTFLGFDCKRCRRERELPGPDRSRLMFLYSVYAAETK